MKKILIILLAALSCLSFNLAYSDEALLNSYTQLRTIDKGTFNEYRYKISRQYFKLRDSMEINGKMNKEVLSEMISLANTGYKYLSNNLDNENYLNYLVTSLRKGQKNPDNNSNYAEIVKRLSSYLQKVDVKQITGAIEAIPIKGNAPHTVTLRGKVKDPTGTKIPSYNYVWWIDTGSDKQIIGRQAFLNYTFNDEGTFAIFLDVVSNHKNANGLTDVLPYREKVTITVEEKVASLILNVNGESLANKDNIKFTPSESSYGLIFDATSSTPASGAKFLKTSWDFGNGKTLEYNGSPRVERVLYPREGTYNVKLKLSTNELKTITKEFSISIHNLIATINSTEDEGSIGDKISFSAKPSGNKKGLSYTWEILDIENNKVVFRKSGQKIAYTFLTKGKFNVRLNVLDSSSDSDIDTKIINIKSRPPVVNLKTGVPETNKPNTVLFDASRSYDPDFSDDGRLEYTWFLDGEKVNLENPNSNGSVGYYTFDSIGSHSIGLEVKDPSGITTTHRSKVSISSLLSVDFAAYPRAIQREGFIKFITQSPEADAYEWDFGDGTSKGGKLSKITNVYDRSGTYNVKLKVIDKKGNINSVTKVVYVGESDRPLAMIKTAVEGGKGEIIYDEEACDGQGAYVADRVNMLKFDGKDSINIDGKHEGLEFSWKIGQSKYSTAVNVNNRFDEFGCFKVKVTVKSKDNGKTDSEEILINVRNISPTLNSLNIDVTNPEGDPLIVNVNTVGAKDMDGIIQSYLWYYYTDLDSEPQDFRATSRPNTTFVIPKITGNYYFVAVLKDDNEDKVSSEEVTDSKYYITLTGDNINTPLINLKVNDSSISVGDEVTFTANVKNILGQDIGDKSVFSWDFDGDGFYEKETKTNNIVYKFKKSGDFNSKVKVKYKGISNTRNVKVNVLNRLYPNFDYISIGSKFIFLNKSTGEIDSVSWDLGDGTKVDSTNFVHVYEDKKPSHEVKLDVIEGTTSKTITKKVVQNVKNKIKSHKKGLNIFSYPKIDDKGDIVLEEVKEKVFIYTGDSKGEIKNYIVDFDILEDSDLNGGKDDDEDNRGTSSYTTGDVFEVELNNNKKQTIRVYIKDTNNKLIKSEDINIIKEYIKEEEIDINSIDFKGIKDSDKEKIAKLKELILKLNNNHKLKSLEFVKKLQEEWFDNTEKTKVIINFEAFLEEEEVNFADEIIEVLESLLVEGQEDKSERNIAFNALKNLLPKTIICDNIGEFQTCYLFLIDKLEKINNSDDIEQNRLLAKDILEIIKDTKIMTPKEGSDFKAILNSLVYGGFENIPDEDIQDVKDDNTDTDSENTFMSIILGIFYWLGIFILVFLGIALIWFIVYKLINKDENVTFTDYILKKTSKGINNENIVDNSKKDILGEIESSPEVNNKEKEVSSVFSDKNEDIQDNKKDLHIPKKDVTKKEEKKDAKVPDWLAGSFGKEENKKVDKKVETKEVKPEATKKEKLVKKESKIDLEKETKLEDDTNTPDWLKQETPKKDVAKKEDKKDAKVPDWLAGSFGKEENKKVDKKVDKKVEIKEVKPEATKKEELVKKESKIDLEKETKLEDDTNTPDWLKQETPKKDVAKKEDKKDAKVPDWLAGSFGKEEDKKDKKEKKEKTKETKEVKSQVTKKEEPIKKESKIDLEKEAKLEDDTNTPDWLKQEAPKKNVVKKEKKKDAKVPDWLAGSFGEEEDKKVDKKEELKKTEEVKPEATKKEEPIKKESKINLEEEVKPEEDENASKDDKSKKTNDKGQELWDDGMDVPDWLKSGDK